MATLRSRHVQQHTAQPRLQENLGVGDGLIVRPDHLTLQVDTQRGVEGEQCGKHRRHDFSFDRDGTIV